MYDISFPPDSKLQIIEECPFLNSTYNTGLVNEIAFPSNLKVIEPSAFAEFCGSLQKITIPFDSNLEIIGKNAFQYSSIENLSLPRQFKIIDDSAFYYSTKLKTILFPPDSKLQIIGPNAFQNSSIENYQKEHFVVVKSSEMFKF